MNNLDDEAGPRQPEELFEEVVMDLSEIERQLDEDIEQVLSCACGFRRGNEDEDESPEEEPWSGDPDAWRR